MTKPNGKSNGRKRPATKKGGKTISAKSQTAKSAGKTNGAKRQTATKSANAIGSWTVKGVEKETITGAKMAAKRDGVFLGAWVNRVLRDAANDRLSETPVPAVPGDDMMTALAELTAKVDGLANQRGFLGRWFS